MGWLMYTMSLLAYGTHHILFMWPNSQHGISWVGFLIPLIIFYSYATSSFQYWSYTSCIGNYTCCILQHESIIVQMVSKGLSKLSFLHNNSSPPSMTLHSPLSWPFASLSLSYTFATLVVAIVVEKAQLGISFCLRKLTDTYACEHRHVRQVETWF